MSEVRRAVDGMLAAVAVEQKAVQDSKPRADGVRHGDGVQPVPGSRGLQYEFRMAAWPTSWQSGPVLVRAGDGQPWLNAEVVSVSASAATGCQVLVEVAAPLPPGARTVAVREDPASALRTLAGRLQDLGSRPADEVRLALAVAGGSVRTGTGLEREVTARVLAVGRTRWNPEQECAVAQALGSELPHHMVAGTGQTRCPPGGAELG
jgi:hypothetical protein